MNEKKRSYWEKLKDPRWQRMRLQVLERSDFHCEICGDGESPLHVHHKEYFVGHDPWEYDIKQLAALCETCHEVVSSFDSLKYVCSYLEMDGPSCRDEAAVLIAGFSGMDYEGFLHVSGKDDTECTQRLYKAGLNARWKFKGGAQ